MEALGRNKRRALRSFALTVVTFRNGLTGYDQQFFDEVIEVALGQSRRRRKGALLSAEAKAVVAKDIGPLRIDMGGGYKTCGGDCSSPGGKGTPGSEIWCTTKCTGEVHKDCSCHLYRYKTPKPGNDPPPKKDWEHVWKDGDTEYPTKEKGYTYECVCVR
jgi:hypothetical protein